MTGPSALLHLVRRFLGSLGNDPPVRADEAWALSHLLPGEQELWQQMSNPDRRHAIGVARGVAADLGDEGARPVIAAALLHDVGKIDTDLSTMARVVATVVWAVVDDRRADEWIDSDAGWPRSQLARYRRHPEIGEALLVRAGSDPLTSGWAADHHKPSDRWRAAPSIAAALHRNDND